MKPPLPAPGNTASSPVDWAEIQQRLEKARRTIEQGGTPGAEEKERILKARARALAQEPVKERAAEEHIEVVEFLLAYERYGIETSFIREVYPLRELAPVPCTPPFVLGVINLRGQILSVMDLKKFFDLPEKGLTDLNKVLVVRSQRMELGILADVILGVHAVALDDLQPPPPTLTGIGAEYLRGVTGERLVVLDTERILSDERIVVQEEVRA